MLGMPPECSVDRLAAAAAKLPMYLRSSSVSSLTGLSSSSSLAMALPPKMSPAPVVSTGCTLGQAAWKAAVFVFSRQPSGPSVTMARDTPNSVSSLSAPSSGVQFQRNSTSLSLIFTTSA